jgi:hypothetical protein
MSVTPTARAQNRVASSTLPSGPGGVISAMRGTLATTAGISVIRHTEGNEPLPRGT